MSDTTTTEYPETGVADADERRRIGQRFEALLVSRRIEKYYFARGEWHVVLTQGPRIVLGPEQADVWLSGFRHGLVAGVTS